MAVGWARDGAVQEQIDASINDEVKRVRHSLPEGESLTHCMECGEEIPPARRNAVPGVKLCIHCQSMYEQRQPGFSGINRRGSKDSQLK